MLAHVTNGSGCPRGFATLDRGVVVLERGESELLDLADHPSHAAWRESGEVRIAQLSDKDARAARKRLESEADTRAAGQTEALATLPRATTLRE